MLQLALLVSLLGVANPVNSTRGPHILTTRELRSLIPGSYIVKSDIPESLRYMNQPEEFRQNGRYIYNSDNFEAHGTFTIKNNMVCTKTDSRAEFCRYIIVDQDRRYWLVASLEKKVVTEIKVVKTTRR
jgi:hypothetical protein